MRFLNRNCLVNLQLVVFNCFKQLFIGRRNISESEFGSVQMGKSARRKQWRRKPAHIFFGSKCLQPCEFKRFWQVWVKTWSLYWIIRAWCKKKKKRLKSARNNYFSCSCILSTENNVIVCKSQGHNNFTFNPRYRRLHDFETSSHASVCLGSCILLWRLNAL